MAIRRLRNALNATHSVRRSAADKRNAVKDALRDPEYVDLEHLTLRKSQAEVAEACGVDQQLVSEVMRLQRINPKHARPNNKQGAEVTAAVTLSPDASTEEKDQEALRLHRAGESDKAIARALWKGRENSTRPAAPTRCSTTCMAKETSHEDHPNSHAAMRPWR